RVVQHGELLSRAVPVFFEKRKRSSFLLSEIPDAKPLCTFAGISLKKEYREFLPEDKDIHGSPSAEPCPAERKPWPLVSDDRGLDIQIATGGVAVGAYDMGLLHEILDDGLVDARHGNLQRRLDAEAAAVLARTDAHRRGDLRRLGDRHLLLAGHHLQRAEEAGRIASGEQLLRIGPLRAVAAEFLG